jgi:hypothetical protein
MSVYVDSDHELHLAIEDLSQEPLSGKIICLEATITQHCRQHHAKLCLADI